MFLYSLWVAEAVEVTVEFSNLRWVFDRSSPWHPNDWEPTLPAPDRKVVDRLATP